MRQVGAQLDLVEGCYRAGDGARFARMQQADARLLQRAKAAIRADGSSPGSLMGSGDAAKKSEDVRPGSLSVRRCVTAPKQSSRAASHRPGSVAVSQLGAGRREPCSGERPVWWPEEEGKKTRQTRRRDGVEGVCRATLWERCVWDG
jgi:hypothetical protein